MKKKNVVLIVAVLVLFFQSCLPSLHPLYTSDTTTVNDKILGEWADGGSDFENIKLNTNGALALIDSSRISKYGISNVFKFEKAKGNSYELTHFDDKGIEAKFEIHLVKLGGNYYMDFYPITEMKNAKGGFSLDYEKFNSFEAWHYYPVHTFAKVTFDEGAMTISLFDGEYLEELVKQNRIRIKYEETDQGTIFTASTKELQEFVLKYGDDENLFMESDPLIKI